MDSIHLNQPARLTSLVSLPVIQLIILLSVGIALRLAWLGYTNATYEDAFITFRYARNLAIGQGFVYNPGEQIYGTTTPLFTLLLAGWLTVFPNDVVLGARVINMMAAISSLTLICLVLGQLGISGTTRAIAMTLLVVSHKLWTKDTGGMETPLVICLMMVTWYASVRDWPIRAGISAGLLLWTRIDLVFWLVVLVMVAWHSSGRFPIRIIVTAGVTYLPWLVFATSYFGSPIPYTIIAKWTSYIVNDQKTLLDHLLTILRWLTPFTVYNVNTDWIGWQYALTIITISLAIWGAFKFRLIKPLTILPAFAIFEIVRLTLTRTTFEDRYLMPLWWVTLLLCGLGLAAIWNRLIFSSSLIRRGAVAVALITILASLVVGYQQAQMRRDAQIFRYSGTLKGIGQWLNQHTPLNATVLLEPLGYIGYYADRHMIDEVGLVSPKIVALKQQGIKEEFEVIHSIRPDYVVIHCDDVLRLLASEGNNGNDFSAHYLRAVTFNPLSFKPGDPDQTGLQRSSCYEVWEPRRD